MKNFIIKSKSYNVLGEELEVYLCQYENKIDWAQPYFQRCWTEIEFSSEIEALTQLQNIYPDRKLTVLEDTGKILSTWSHETNFTSMKIIKINEGDF